MANRPILVLGKARRILDCFSPERPELTFGEVRRATGYPASTCLRILNSLREYGFLEREDDRYRVGLKMLTWAAAAASGLDITRRAGPVLRQLRDLTGETAIVYVPRGDVRVCVGLEETHHSVRRLVNLGQVMPLYAGSGGKVILAYDPHLADRVLAGELQPYTAHTLVDRRAWDEELRRIRRQGYAVSYEERDDGAASLSAPVFDDAGRVAGALGIVGPSQRFRPEHVEQWVRPVVAAAAELSRQLGYRADPGAAGDAALGPATSPGRTPQANSSREAR